MTDIATLIKAATALPKELKEKEKALKSKKTGSTSSSSSIGNVSVYTSVDSTTLDRIKRACKNDSTCLSDAARYLGMDLNSNHGVVRLLSLIHI